MAIHGYAGVDCRARRTGLAMTNQGGVHEQAGLAAGAIHAGGRDCFVSRRRRILAMPVKDRPFWMPAAHGFFPKAARCSNSITSSATITIMATVEPSARTTGMPLIARTPNDAAVVRADMRTETGVASRR